MRLFGLMVRNMLENIWVEKNRQYFYKKIIIFFLIILEDKKHGTGTFEWGNGKKYEGHWVNGK